VIGRLEVGIDPCSLDNASGLWEPCFEASAVRMEVSESNFCLQLHFVSDVSAPLVQQNLPAKSDLENVYSAVVVFSSDTSTYRFTGKPVSQTTGLLYVKRGIEAAGLHWTRGLAGKHFSVIGAL